MTTKSVFELISSGYDTFQRDGPRDFMEEVLQWWHIRNKDSLTLSCDGVSVTFDTTLDVAKDWFYPRYLDGSLHEPVMTREILKTLDSDTTFYDVGALMGYYSIFASSVCTEGEVHTFELDPIFIDAIKKSLDRNETEASVVQRAVSETSGVEVSYEGDVGLTSISNDHSENTVETLSIDDYTESNSQPDVMKVDVEGFEYKVLRGAEGTLENGHPQILFLEVHPSMMQGYDDSVEDILKLLKRHNYTHTVLGNHRDQNSPEYKETKINENMVLRCKYDG
ncbi:FkbM family methyltransferase [Halapricum desulfuricans]|nr:FkbM family methyltransferase [Halapricum desulfuricans]